MLVAISSQKEFPLSQPGRGREAHGDGRLCLSLESPHCALDLGSGLMGHQNETQMGRLKRAKRPFESAVRVSPDREEADFRHGRAP